MIYRHWIQVGAGTLPAEDYMRLCALAPAFVTSRGITMHVDTPNPTGNDVVQTFLDICKRNGLQRAMLSAADCYGYYVDRGYEKNDLGAACFLLLLRQREIQRLEHERDAQGRPLLVASKAKSSIKIGRIWANWIIVSDKVRKLLETQDFKRLEFGGVVLKGASMYACKEPFWELKSSVTLPVMANGQQLIQPGMSVAEPFQGDVSKMAFVEDPPFNMGEIHYRRSELARLLPFDIAQTFENFMEPHPALIVSQRFYQFCLRNKISLNVQPVRIDD